MAALGAEAMLGGGRRTAPGMVTRCVDAFRPVAGRAGSRWGNRGTLLMATGPRLRPGDILPSRAHVRIGSDTYVRARFWQYGLRAAN